MKVEVAFRTAPAVGETENGDRATHVQAEKISLIGVLDGLGHGPDAAKASQVGVSYLERADLEAPMLQIMEGLHRTMAGTRGAAGTVVLFREGKVEACAVGNVELRSGDLRLPLVATPGVLGVRVRKFRTCEAVVSRPGRAILFSDGISSRAPFLDFLRLGPGEFCEEILNSYRRDHDDSTVLAADVEPF